MSSSDRVLRFEPDETPPHFLAGGLGLQYILLTVTGIVLVPAIVVRAGGGSEGYLSWAVFAVLAVSGVSTLLQVRQFGRIGSGYVLLMGTSGAFIAVCVAALQQGGPGLLAALVLASSLIQLGLSQRLSWVRRIFTPTVTGTVLMLIAVTVMPIVFDMLKTPEGANSSAVLASASVTLVTVVAVALRGTGAWRLWAPVLGIVVGCVVAAAMGHYDTDRVANAAWFGLPAADWPGIDLGFGPAFWRLLPAFVFVTLVGAIETIGDAVAIQRVSWRKQRAVDYRAVQGAVAADGVGNLLSGLLATVPNTTYSTSVAIVELTGVAARRVGVYIGAFLMALALCPKILAVFIAIPDAVAAGYILTLVAMLFVLGMRIVVQDGADYRKAIVAGVSFWLGSGFENGLIFPNLLAGGWDDLLGNGMVAGGFSAIALTAFVELTNPRPRRIETALDPGELPKIQEFLGGFAARLRRGERLAEHLRAVAEESILALLEQGEAGARRLRLIARSDGQGTVVELEFLAGSAGTNLEDRLAAMEGPAGPIEQELSLRLLRHLATSVHHQQYHDIDVLTVVLDSRDVRN